MTSKAATGGQVSAPTVGSCGWATRHPVATFFALAYAMNSGMVFAGKDAATVMTFANWTTPETGVMSLTKSKLSLSRSVALTTFTAPPRRSV